MLVIGEQKRKGLGLKYEVATVGAEESSMKRGQ